MIEAKLIGLFKILLAVFAGIAVITLATAVGARMWLGPAVPFIFHLGPTEIFVLLALLLVLFVWIAIGVFVYHDARQRGMEPLLWALVAALVPYFLGLVAYLVFRHPIQRTCPACGLPFAANDVFCSRCGRIVQAQCKSCHRPLAADARFCAFCGTPLNEAPAS